MATREEEERLNRAFEALSESEQTEQAEQAELFSGLADEIEVPGIQDRILERYNNFGREMLGDALPSHVDPRVAKILEPMLGNVSDVRVHTGTVATQAAKAMNARAFAVGDRDIFFDRSEFNPNSAQGGALIAHEIAHTRDAATGFALSKQHGSDSSAREAFAHEVEHKFALEYEADAEGVVRPDDAPSEIRGSDGMPKDPKVDKFVLAQKVSELIEKQQRGFSERHGHWERIS